MCMEASGEVAQCAGQVHRRRSPHHRSESDGHWSKYRARYSGRVMDIVVQGAT